MAFRAFLTSELGAVTVDWVVLTGTLVALGLAATTVVAVGVGDMSEDVSGEIRDTPIRTAFSYGVGSDDFEGGGLGGWVGGLLDYDAGYGNVLRGGGSNGLQAVRNTYDLEDGMNYAVVSFDVHALDSWDNETFTIFANDEPVATASFNFGTDGSTGTWVTNNPDIQLTMSQSGPRSDGGFNSTFTDQSYSVQMRVSNPGDELTLGFGSDLDQSVGDESWAVDNIDVVSTNTSR